MKLKNVRKNTIASTIVAILLQSCAMIRDVQPYKIDSIDKNNYSKLNGWYSNIHTDTTVVSYNDSRESEYRSKTLWSHTYSYNKDKEEGYLKEQTVKIEFKTRRRILVSLYENDSLAGGRKIRGRINNGFFYARPHLNLIPLIPIVVSYDTYRYRIGLTNNSIVIDYRWNFWGFALIAGGTGKGQTSSTFKKL
jgi:hypothetical protein